MTGIPEIDLSSTEVLNDPFTAYGTARETAPLARLVAPGLGTMWAVLRHEGVRTMLGDQRFEVTAESYVMRPRGLAEEYQPYLRTMQEMDGPEHLRLRRLVSPAFTARRAAVFRPRIEAIAGKLLDQLAARAADGTVDLQRWFTRPLPIEVICEFMGIPEADRPRWHEYGAAIAAGSGEGFVAAIPGIIDGAKAAIAHRRREPGDDLISELVRARAGDGDRLEEAEVVTLVWQLVLAGQVPANLLAAAVGVLFAHPEQLTALREDPGLAPGAVEELIRWCGPQLLAIPRYAREDMEISAMSEMDGVRIVRGEPVIAVIAAANRDPRAFTEPDRFDIRRDRGAAGHLGFAHGPHFCLGAALARVQVEVALTALLRRFPRLAAAREAPRLPDPATWRHAEVPVALD